MMDSSQFEQTYLESSPELRLKVFLNDFKVLDAQASSRGIDMANVILTGREYLSPLSEPYDHFWPYFIKKARKTLLENSVANSAAMKQDKIKLVNDELFDFIGSVIVRVWYND